MDMITNSYYNLTELCGGDDCAGVTDTSVTNARLFVESSTFGNHSSITDCVISLVADASDWNYYQGHISISFLNNTFKHSKNCNSLISSLC